MPKDYYAILEVQKDADPEQIKRAYRKKARRLHPDLNQSSRAKDDFQELQEAYSVLSDPDLRHQYDIGILFREEYVPPPPPPQQDYQSTYSGWSRAYKYESANLYNTDYEANKKSATWVCLGVLVFSLSFFIDLGFHHTLGTSKVLSVQNKALSTQNLRDAEEVIITTDQLSFEKTLGTGEIRAGDQIEIRESLIYRFLSFRRVGGDRFSYMNILPILVYITALLVLLSGLYGITPFTKAERKFNSAIIGSFFSFALIILLIFR